MRIIPHNFKQRTKFLKAQLQKKENIKISSSQFNDAIAKSYGWIHYHEMKTHIKNHTTYSNTQEYNLTIDEENDLITKKIEQILILCRNLIIKDESNQIEFEQVTTRLCYFIYSFLSASLLNKKISITKKNALPLHSEQLKLNTLISTINYNERIQSTIALIKNKTTESLSMKDSIWIINTSEFEALSDHLLFLKKIKHTVEVIKINKDCQISIDFNDCNKHQFFVYPDNFNKNNNCFISTPEAITNKIIQSSNHILADKININGVMKSHKPSHDHCNLIIYINADICDFSQEYSVFITQARLFGVASIICTNSIDDFTLKNKDIQHQIIGNSFTKIINIHEEAFMSLILSNIKMKNLSKIQKYADENREISSIARFSINLRQSNVESFVFLNKEGDIHSLVGEVLT